MTATVQTWNEIMGGRTGDDAASSALARLREAPWLANVGEPSSRDGNAARVHGWDDALAAFKGGGLNEDGSHKTYDGSGTLYAPLWLLLGRIDSDDELNRRTATAANHALDALLGYYSAVGDGVCAHMAPDADTFDIEITVGDYVHRFIQLLFIEIYAGDVAEPRCTYFRDQLGWFLAGFLPCGWEGEWPHGRMRVF